MKSLTLLVSLVLFLTGCSKNNNSGLNNGPGSGADTLNTLSYGDSIFYVKTGGEDQLIFPKGNLSGTFFAFPDGIEINPITGAINVDKSETGLRYRISFVAQGSSDTLSTVVLLSGINYLDKIYYLDENDTSAVPVYNAGSNNTLPVDNSVFDEGDGCKNLGVVVHPQNGTINLAQTIRNGVLGDTPKNGSQKEVELLYRVNDASKKALNRLKVKFYYFDTPGDIDQDLVQLMSDRKGMFIGITPPPFLEYNPSPAGLTVSSNSILGTAKPRPPCIFVVGKRSR